MLLNPSLIWSMNMLLLWEDIAILGCVLFIKAERRVGGSKTQYSSMSILLLWEDIDILGWPLFIKAES